MEKRMDLVGKPVKVLVEIREASEPMLNNEPLEYAGVEEWVVFALVEYKGNILRRKFYFTSEVAARMSIVKGRQVYTMVHPETIKYPICRGGCEKFPNQIPEYIVSSRLEGIPAVQYVIDNEGTYDPNTETFICSSCYIKQGMPLNK